jgi:hypothetical protein
VIPGCRAERPVQTLVALALLTISSVQDASGETLIAVVESLLVQRRLVLDAGESLAGTRSADVWNPSP